MGAAIVLGGVAFAAYQFSGAGGKSTVSRGVPVEVLLALLVVVGLVVGVMHLAARRNQQGR
jgi:hypothetical protein